MSNNNIPQVNLNLVFDFKGKERSRFATVKPSPNNKNRFYVYVSAADYTDMRFDFNFGGSLGLVKVKDNPLATDDIYLDSYDPIFDEFALIVKSHIESLMPALDLIKLLDWQENAIAQKELLKIQIRARATLECEQRDLELKLASIKNRIEDIKNDPAYNFKILSI